VNVKLYNILVLGAGRVAKPCVQYLLRHSNFKVMVIDRDISNAKRIIGNHFRAKAFKASEIEEFKTMISESDVVINLLPSSLEPQIAKLCIAAGKPMVGTNYVREELQSLNQEAVKSNVIILSELGLDPGIDHMSAVRTIHQIQNKGGMVKGFYSWCGALPASESNTNPFGYKISWSPAGLIGTCERPAEFLKNGKKVNIPGSYLMGNYSFKEFSDLGWFEEYPNGNSFPYIELYGLNGVKDIYRATIRYIGWCETMKKLGLLGMFKEEEKSLKGLSCKQFTAQLIGASNDSDLPAKVAEYLGLDTYSAVLKKIEWLGLFSNELLPYAKGSNKDILSYLFLKKLKFGAGERDLVIMQHEYIADFPGENMTKKYTSTFIDYGNADKDTSVARTTGIPPAIGAKLIVEGKITRKGVVIPVYEDIYGPILLELENEGINFLEKEELL
jgi:saccharopine dehydrogenase-like NADP-dependent oxidoreductase